MDFKAQLVRYALKKSRGTCRSTTTIISLLFFAVLVALPTMAAPPADVTLAEQQVIRRGNGAEPQSLDPHIAEDTASSHIQRDLFEGLIAETPTGELTAGVAERWDISEDRLRYTFYLRKDARWSNGDPVTAQDFVYSWRRLVDPQTASNYALMLGSIVNAEAIIRGDITADELAVRALDDHTLQVDLGVVTPYFLSVLTHSTTYPVHLPSLERHGNRFTRAGNLVSNGAYQLAEWEVQSHIKLVRNPHYWDNTNTTIEEVYFYPGEDLNAEVLRYRAGGIDMTNNALPAGQMRWLRQNLADELHIDPYLGIYYYGFNMEQPPFKDSPLSLRKALSMTIDREIITEKLLNNGSMPAYSFVPPGVLDYESYEYEWAAMDQEARLVEARRLYEEAGYSKDNPFRVELRYNTDQNHKRIALAIAAMWKQNLGVITEIINQEWKVFLDVRSQRRITQTFRMGWIGDYNDAYSFLELGLSYNSMNDSGYNNPDYDALLARSFQANSTGERAQIMRKAEEVFLSDYPIVPIYYYVSARLIKPHVGGFEGNIMDHIYTKHLYIKSH